MKSLFDENGERTKESLELEDETHKALSSIFQKYRAIGYNMGDIARIMHISVSDAQKCLSDIAKNSKRR